MYIKSSFHYAVAIHKSQSLPLDCAIIDLSSARVFSAGIAYVALSRIQSLSGVYLATFDPKSIMVCVACPKVVNRLKDTYRKVFPGTSHPDQPKAKIGIPTGKTKKAKKGSLTSKKAYSRKLSKPHQPKK